MSLEATGIALDCSTMRLMMRRLYPLSHVTLWLRDSPAVRGTSSDGYRKSAKPHSSWLGTPGRDSTPLEGPQDGTEAGNRHCGIERTCVTRGVTLSHSTRTVVHRTAQWYSTVHYWKARSGVSLDWAVPERSTRRCGPARTGISWDQRAPPWVLGGAQTREETQL